MPRGAGTSLAGQCANVAVVFDYSRFMNGLMLIDPAAKLATVEPGIVLDRLRDAAELYHLTYAPDPATHSRCTLGGMIGNNSCGVHGLLGGKVVDNVRIARHRSLRRHAHDGGPNHARRNLKPRSAQAAAWARSTPAWPAFATGTPT